MSLDFMILGSLEGDRPLGPWAVVLDLARNALGIDLDEPDVEIAGVRLEVSLQVEHGVVACIHVTPHDDDFERALRALAEALGAVVFDAQTGLELGIEASALPDRVDGRYDLQLVALDLGCLGPEDEVWKRIAGSLGISRLDASTSGEGWTLRAELVPGGSLVSRVRLGATWSDPAARDEVFGRVVRAAEQNGWVPFDPQRNDTLQ